MNEFNDLTRDKYGIIFNNIKEFNNKEFSKSNNFLHSFYKDLDIGEIKIINTLLYIFSTYSKMLKNDEFKTDLVMNNFLNEGFFEFKFQEIKKIMKISPTTSIYELEQKIDNIRVKTFKYVKVNGNKTERCLTSFISKCKIVKRNDIEDMGDILKETRIKIYFDRELYQDIFYFTGIGYTVLNIDINKIKSKMGVGLYEELKRITPLKQIRKKDEKKVVTEKFKQIHTYKLEEFNFICGSDYKYLSTFLQNLLIQYKKLVDLKLIDDIYTFRNINKKIEIQIVRPRFFEDDEQYDPYTLKKKKNRIIYLNHRLRVNKKIK